MKVLVVDDHPIVRDALCRTLKELDPDIAVFEAANGHETIDLVEQYPDLDLILLDLSLPDRDGFDLLADLRANYPSIAVVVLSAFDEPVNVARALEIGALGFIPKNTSREVILGALQLVLSGGIYIPPHVVMPKQTTARAAVPNPSAAQPPTSPEDLGLTQRQINVLALMMKGKSNKTIGRELDLAEPTVKYHVAVILKALQVTNRTEAVLAVGQLGWVIPDIVKS
jgi:DNA-binding NarL/FixJ family response regulator